MTCVIQRKTAVGYPPKGGKQFVYLCEVLLVLLKTIISKMTPSRRVRQSCITEMFAAQQQIGKPTVQKKLRLKGSQLAAAENVATIMETTSPEIPDSCSFNTPNLKEFFQEYNNCKYPVSYEVFKKHINHEYLMKRIIYKQVKGDPHKLRSCYRNKEYYEKSLHSYYESFYRHPENRNKYKYVFKDASPEELQILLSTMEVRGPAPMISIPMRNLEHLEDVNEVCSANRQSGSHVSLNSEVEQKSTTSELSATKGLATEQAVAAEEIRLSKDVNVIAPVEEPPIIAVTQEPIAMAASNKNTSKSNTAMEVHLSDSQVVGTTAVEPSQAKETANVVSKSTHANAECTKPATFKKKVLYPVSLETFKKYIDCDRAFKIMAQRHASGDANKYKQLLNDAAFRDRQLYMLYVTFYVDPSTRKVLNFQFDGAPAKLKERLLRVATVLADETQTKAASQTQECVESEAVGNGTLEIANISAPVESQPNLIEQETIAVADPTPSALETYMEPATADAQISEAIAAASVVEPPQSEETIKDVDLETNANAASQKQTMPKKKVLYPVTFATFKKYIDSEKAIKIMSHRDAKKYTQLLNDASFRDRQLHKLYVTYYVNPSTRKVLNFKFDGAPPKLKEKLLSTATVLEKSTITPERLVPHEMYKHSIVNYNLHNISDYISAKIKSPQLLHMIKKRFAAKQLSSKVQIISNYLLSEPTTAPAPEQTALQEPDQVMQMPTTTSMPLQPVTTAQQVLNPADVDLPYESQPNSSPAYKTRTQAWVSSINECSPSSRRSVKLCTSHDLLHNSNVATISSPLANTTIGSSSCGQLSNQELPLPCNVPAITVTTKTQGNKFSPATPKHSLAVSPSTNSAPSAIVTRPSSSALTVPNLQPDMLTPAALAASQELQHTQLVASSPEANKPALDECRPVVQCHDLQYMVRVNHGVKQQIWRAIKDMSFEDFKEYVGMYSEKTIQEDDLQQVLQQVYSDTIASNNWPMNIYIKMASIVDFLVANKVKMNELNLKYISPKLLHWSELMVYTTFDDCLSFDYYKRHGRCPEEKQLSRERLAYYTRCWFHDKWISQRPRVTFSEFNIDFDTKMCASQADNAFSLPSALQVFKVDSRLAARTQMASQTQDVDAVTLDATEENTTTMQMQHCEHSYSMASIPIHTFVDMERFESTQAEVDSEAMECDPLTDEAASTLALCDISKPVTIKQEPLDKLLFTLNASNDDNGYECENIPDNVLNIDDDEEDKELAAFKLHCLRLNCTNSESLESSLFDSDPTLPHALVTDAAVAVEPEQQSTAPVAVEPEQQSTASVAVEPEQQSTASLAVEPEQQSTASAEANNADLCKVAPPAKRGKLYPFVVLQKLHSIRALPLVSQKTTNPSNISSNNCLSASQALATDNTLFNSTQLQNLLEQPQGSNASQTVTEAGEAHTAAAATTDGSSIVAPFVTIRKVNTDNVIVQQENLPQGTPQPQQCVAVYRKLLQFHYYRDLSTEQIETHNLSTNAIGRSYQQALIYYEGKCYVHGALLTALFPHCSAQLHQDVQLVLNTLDEFHFNMHINFSREPDVRKLVLYHFMRSYPVFCNFLLDYERGTRNFARCIPIDKKSGPYLNPPESPGLGSVQYAIKPITLVRMATLKLRLQNSDSNRISK